MGIRRHLQTCWPGVLTTGLVVGVGLSAASPAAILSTAVAVAVFAVPGFFLLGRGSLRSPSMAALAAAVGIGATISAVAAAGWLTGKYSLGLVVTAPLLLCFGFHLLRTRFAPPLLADDPQRVWAMIGIWAVLAMIFLPYAFVGADTGQEFAYRPFFQADFFKHMGHTYAVTHGELPPVDLFSCRGTLHYYWLAYLLPATAVAVSGASATAQEALLLVGLVQTVLLALLVFAAARALSGSPKAAAAATSLGFLCLTLDGPLFLMKGARFRLRNPGVEIDWNPEKMDLAWTLGLGHLNVNSLHRLCLYVQQHQLAVVLFVAWIVLATLPKMGRCWAITVAKSMLIVPLFGTSFLVGVVATTVVILTELSAARERGNWPDAALAILCTLLSVSFFFGTGMAAGTAQVGVPVLNSSLTVHERLVSAASLPLGVVSNWGVLAVLGVWGTWLLSRDRSLTSRARTVVPLTVLITMGIFLVGELLLSPKMQFEVELKTSYVAGVALVLGASVVFSRTKTLWQRHRKTLSICVVLAVLGLSTPVLDILWHCKISGSTTTLVPAGDMEALDWIRRETPPQSIFQCYPYRHFDDIDVWVPIFAGRRIIASPRGSNSDEALVQEIAGLFDETNSDELWRRASSFGISYLYLHRTMGNAKYERLVEELWTSPDRFSVVFANGETTVWMLTQPQLVGE